MNLVLWLHGKHGVVRFAPYDECERLSAEQRWRAYRWEQARPVWQELAGGSLWRLGGRDGERGGACGKPDTTGALAEASTSLVDEDDAAAFEEL